MTSRVHRQLQINNTIITNNARNRFTRIEYFYTPTPIYVGMAWMMPFVKAIIYFSSPLWISKFCVGVSKVRVCLVLF